MRPTQWIISGNVLIYGSHFRTKNTFELTSARFQAPVCLFLRLNPMQMNLYCKREGNKMLNLGHLYPYPSGVQKALISLRGQNWRWNRKARTKLLIRDHHPLLSSTTAESVLETFPIERRSSPNSSIPKVHTQCQVSSRQTIGSTFTQEERV